MVELFIIISNFFSKASNVFLDLAARKDKKNLHKKLNDLINNYTDKTEKFFEDPKKLSKLKKYKEFEHSVFLYVALKQVVALYEAEAEVLPIQVYNEIRNAYDHINRGLIAKNIPGNIEKIEGHIQRAFLDTCKLTSHFYQDRLTATHRRYPRKSLSLVSNGDYLKEFTGKEAECRLLLIQARESDFNLSGDRNQNLVILENYVRAMLAYKQLSTYQIQNLGNLTFNKYKFYWISGWSMGLTFTVGVITSLVAAFIYSEFLEEIKCRIVDLFLK